ncbi:hypothetical protein [Marinobacter sp. VGCF2001]|uniref:hypothetical protein n=1 Tax=Marinobacter sp. VGCF2001 TaxID=3417189 RepID=UPI003CEA9A3A
MDSARRPPLIPMRPMKLPMKLSLVTALALWLVLAALNQPLHTAAAPQGMVSLQLAGTADQTHAILRSWRDGNLGLARLSLWLDLAFIVVYLATLLQLTRHFTRDRPGVRERMVARWVRVLFVIAGLSDVAENIVLLNNFNPPSDTLSLTATILALLKFTGLILGMAGLVVIRASRRRPLSTPH